MSIKKCHSAGLDVIQGDTRLIIGRSLAHINYYFLINQTFFLIIYDVVLPSIARFKGIFVLEPAVS
jgi:hypothetical protein